METDSCFLGFLRLGHELSDGVEDDAAAFAVLAAIGLQGIRLVQPSLGECVVVTGLGAGDSRIIYAATRTGAWRSLDRGETWTRLLATQVRGGCLELALRADRADDDADLHAVDA